MSFFLAGGNTSWTPRTPEPFLKPKMPSARGIEPGAKYGPYIVIEWSKRHGKWICGHNDKQVFRRSSQLLCEE